MSTRADYERIFEAERLNDYPVIDDYEQRAGYSIDRGRLEEAARTLACPLKVNAPNWQHGRILYATLRAYLSCQAGPINILDCGTAKGFSALCMAFALCDSGREGVIVSIDVIDPEAQVARNSVADLGKLLTVRELVEPWPESKRIQFIKADGAAWLKSSKERIHFAFIDGKHSYAAVSEEIRRLSYRQQSGDMAIFDDMQIPGVCKAVTSASGYDLKLIEAKPGRKYAVAMRQ